MKKVCVFTGAASGNNPIFKDTAYQLGTMIAARGLGLVYGGGKMGLMGVVADGVIDNNGHVTGIIPRFLDDVEVGHEGVTNLQIIDGMHERKELMYEASDAFVVLPGGLGTLDETMEITTWSQLGLHKKPVIIFNVNGYWDHLLAQMDHIKAQGFMHHDHKEHFNTVTTIDEIGDVLDQVSAST